MILSLTTSLEFSKFVTSFCMIYMTKMIGIFVWSYTNVMHRSIAVKKSRKVCHIKF